MQTVAGAKPVLLLRKDFSSCESVRRRVAEQTKLLRKNKRKIEVLKAKYLTNRLGLSREAIKVK